MKKLIKIAFIFTLLISFYSFSTTEEVLEPNKSENVISTQDWYATTGTTRNTFGQNYSISIRVQGREMFNGCISIRQVQVSSGGSWEKKSYRSVFGEDCTYKVSVNYKDYYFRI